MDPFSLIFDSVIMLGVPAYVVLQIAAIVTARSEPARVVALLPLLISAPLAVWCLYALANESNLWPLPFILFAPMGALYLGVALLARSIFRRQA